jgi:lysophospholipase L1-like esterase
LPGALSGETTWDLAYRGRSSRDRLTIVLPSGEELEARGDEAEPEKIRHLEWRTAKPGAITVKAVGGEPQIFGLTVEAAAPGVVIDTLGLNGARVGTPLAWDAGSWLAEAGRRAPTLVILAYGTNDVGDPGPADAREQEVLSLIDRIRAIQPEVDCLLVGPTDRAGPGWTLVPGVREVEAMQRRVATRSGCAFFSAVDAMGGDGGIKRWAELSPPLATGDRVHLTPRGYAKLGASLATFLLGETVVPAL